ncbi:MAG: DUF2203 family protein [Planctomycetes bacterium]|jgi:hypothetical protein|nr:DUF2203 family protein [Planctomycetota bacterium]
MPINQSTTPTVAPASTDRNRFSVEEANRALPYVQRVVEDVVAVYSHIVELRRKLEDLGAGEEGLDLEHQYEDAMDRLGDLVDELHLVGVELKDFEKGLVDFPACFAGRDILLCWQRGEAGVGYWHETDAGYADRQPVEALCE